MVLRTQRVAGALYLVQEGMPHNQRPKLVGESIKRTFHFGVYVNAMFFGNSSATSTFTTHKIDMCQDRTGTRCTIHIQSAEEPHIEPPPPSTSRPSYMMCAYVRRRGCGRMCRVNGTG